MMLLLAHSTPRTGGTTSTVTPFSIQALTRISHMSKVCAPGLSFASKNSSQRRHCQRRVTVPTSFGQNPRFLNAQCSAPHFGQLDGRGTVGGVHGRRSASLSRTWLLSATISEPKAVGKPLCRSSESTCNRSAASSLGLMCLGSPSASSASAAASTELTRSYCVCCRL